MIDGLRTDEAGFVGRFIVGWLLVVAVLGVGAVDGASIAFTTFRLSDAAATAAAEAASRYRVSDDARLACDAAERAVQIQDPDITFVRCRIDEIGTVTVTVRQKAATFVVDQLSALKKYGRVTRTEAIGGRSV